MILGCGLVPLLGATMLAAADTGTLQYYLSGHGPKDAIAWDFTVTGGRRAGEKTTIGVPSNWEQQGFGTYNYGEDPLPKGDEHGLYTRRFTLPEGWAGKRVRLVFEGVMTDATVRINGRPAGPVHQGGFVRFGYDITTLLQPGGENVLEVDVAKVSANPATEAAERTGDYWVFGGIYRAVYLEARPAQAIEHVAIDARADGNLRAEIDLDAVRDADRVDVQIVQADGQPQGELLQAVIPAGGSGHVSFATKVPSPKLWTAETPNLYTMQLTLRRGAEALHTMTQRFGFRTFEVRPGAGLFLNGQRILLKGVGRHSFRPETARSLDAADCVDDVRLIKGMNMNAVRMTHYPPDVAFLEACDEQGLYVLDELSGWHRAHDTDNGRKLVREMVTRDVNHPSILFWDNGNEGGWNRALDAEFARYDPQQRVVLHPWELFNGVDTKHYPDYADITKRLAGPNVVMPTEMIHGLYDGGAGAGLADYWQAISTSRVGGGGFIWVFADEGIARTDQAGRVDVYSTFAPDGILGPHHEKEGSYYTVRDIYSPVQIEPMGPGGFSTPVKVSNQYDFRSLATCEFRWQLVRFPDRAETGNAPRVIASGTAHGPDIAPHAHGLFALPVPADWTAADAVVLTAVDSDGRELWTWSWPTAALPTRLASGAAVATAAATGAKPAPAAAPKLEHHGNMIQLSAGQSVATFDAGTGELQSWTHGDAHAALTAGPRLVFARASRPEGLEWHALHASNAAGEAGTYIHGESAPLMANVVEIDPEYPKTVSWIGFRLEISPDGTHWKTLYDGSRRAIDGKLYEFPPQPVRSLRLSHFARSDGAAPVITTVRLGFDAARFPKGTSKETRKVEAAIVAPVDGSGGAPMPTVQGTGADLEFRWTLEASGDLRLDYSYTLDGAFSYHGITFDYPEAQMQSLRWLGEGPYRVWQNRLRGTVLGTHETLYNNIQPGESWNYPEFQGFFSGVRWAELRSSAGNLGVASADPAIYIRVGTPRINHAFTTVAFPAGDLSFLHAIPAIGSKFILPDRTGPASQLAVAKGTYHGSLRFHLGAP